MSGVTDVPEAESVCVGSPASAQSVNQNDPPEATWVAPDSPAVSDEQAVTLRPRSKAALPTMIFFTPSGYATVGYMLARSRSTRSSTLTKGSLHRTVRCA